MRKFAVILKYELKEYISSKGFVAFTLLLAIIGAVLLCLPRFIDMSAFTGVDFAGKSETEQAEKEQTPEYLSDKKYALYDPGNITDTQLLSEYFSGAQFVKVSSTGELEKMLEDETAVAGFAVKNQTEYEYYIFNKTMYDSNSEIFDEAMKAMSRARYCAANGLDLNEITQMYEPQITVTEHILNKNTTQSYWYCYALVIIVFMLIMFYGQMIAVSVTTEKSNRAIEVLVTSTTPNSLLFGKVIAGAIAGLLQSGIILGTILAAYQFNREQWGGMLDIILDIPANVLIVFALFGTMGYLFYAFLFGAMGALVSKIRGREQERKRTYNDNNAYLLFLAVPTLKRRRNDNKGSVFPAVQLIHHHVYARCHGQRCSMGNSSIFYNTDSFRYRRGNAWSGALQNGHPALRQSDKAFNRTQGSEKTIKQSLRNLIRRDFVQYALISNIHTVSAPFVARIFILKLSHSVFSK